MLEREIKNYLVKRCRELGIYHRKFTSPGNVAVPDWILINDGKVLFLELKGTGKSPTKAQQRELGRICAGGCYATYASSIEEIDFLIEYLLEDEDEEDFQTPPLPVRDH